MDAPDSDLHGVKYFIKKPGSGSSYEYKFHCASRDNEEFTACNKLALAGCSSVGDLLPDESVLCRACAKARPDFASFQASSETGRTTAAGLEVGDMCACSETIAQKSGLTKNAEDRVTTIDQPVAAAREAPTDGQTPCILCCAVEYLNICEFSHVAGPF